MYTGSEMAGLQDKHKLLQEQQFISGKGYIRIHYPGEKAAAVWSHL